MAPNVIPGKGRGFGKKKAMDEEIKMMKELLPNRQARAGTVDALAWNADVERRRREYHEMRCAGDPMYRLAYERQQEMKRRIQKMNSMAMAQLQNAMADGGDDKCCRLTDQTNVGEEPRRMKTHEEVMEEKAVLIDRMGKDGQTGKAGLLGIAISTGMLAKMLGGTEKANRFLKDLADEQRYADEINKVDKMFDEELIRKNGFEW